MNQPLQTHNELHLIWVLLSLIWGPVHQPVIYIHVFDLYVPISCLILIVATGYSSITYQAIQPITI